MAWIVLAFGNLDGVCSSAVIRRSALLRGMRVRHLEFSSYPRVGQDLENLPVQEGDVVFVLDVSPVEIRSLERVLVKLKLAKAVYWNTHHNVPSEMAERIRRSGVEFDNVLGVSSAGMSSTKFLPQDGVAKELSSIASDIEFWKRRDVRSTKLADLITSGKDKSKLSESLSKGVLWSPEWEKELVVYEKKKKDALSQMLKKLIVRNVSKWKVGYALADSCISSADAGQGMLDAHTEIDVAVILFRSGRLSFRRRDGCAVDVSLLAQKFGGGGHQYASGAQLNRTVTNSSWDEALLIVDQGVKSVLQE